jgi:hypothetical protein
MRHSSGGNIGFKLDKWYFDCVSPQGEVLICYAAKVRYGPLGFSYSARMTKAPQGDLIQRQSLSFGHAEKADGAITLHNRGLRIDGRWSGGSPIARTTLVDVPAGTIEWECLSANAAVSAHIGGRLFEGTGYVERLSMTIPPWRLPFTVLRWGRYISADRRNRAVWIDLVGELNRSWIWLNSDDPVTGNVGDRGVRTNVSELVFETARPIRSDNVAQSLLGRLEFLKRLLPRALRAIAEEKQVASCTLAVGGTTSRGTAISEVVTWG